MSKEFITLVDVVEKYSKRGKYARPNTEDAIIYDALVMLRVLIEEFQDEIYERSLECSRALPEDEEFGLMNAEIILPYTESVSQAFDIVGDTKPHRVWEGKESLRNGK